MTPEQYREVEERFSEALALSRTDRAFLVEKLCVDNPVVGEKLRALLAADARGQDLMEVPAVAAAPDSLLLRFASSPARSDLESLPLHGAGAQTPAQRDFGPYRLLEQLGRGGMGVVYRAEHRETGQQAALKTVVGANENVLSSLRREIRALARLRHPGIVRILDEGVEQGLPWYAMELLEGTPLNQYRSSHGSLDGLTPPAPLGSTTPLTAPISGAKPQAWWTQALSDPTGSAQVTRGTEESSAVAASRLGASALPLAGRGQLPDVLRLVRRLCSALAYLHGEGLVHRDLKPANILVQQGDRPVLVDFGLMTQFSASEVSREVLDVSHLSAGTVTYIAPEQARGEFVDARADLYALGCILYQLVCGRPPFAGGDAMRIIAQHFFAPPVPPSHMAEGVPAELDALILKLLAKEPRNRFGYATDVASALEKLGAADEGAWLDDLPRVRSYLYRPGFGGRQDELDRLLQQLGMLRAVPGTDAREGAAPVVLVGGESGIGKTRLAMEFAREAASEKVRVLVGECLPAASSEQPAASVAHGEVHGEQETRSAPGASSSPSARGSQPTASSSPTGSSLLAAPLHPLRRPLQHIADRCRERGLAETERLLGRRGKVLAAYEPSLDGLPGQEMHATPVELPPSAALLRLYTSLTETFAALAETQVLLLVLDDLQWADELTLGFVDHFLHQTEGPSRNVLLLGTYRTEEVSGALRKLCDTPEAVKLELRRFDEPTVASMIANMLALSAPPRAFSRHLALQSEGNAFFVAEYLRAAVGEGLLWRDHHGVWQVAEGEDNATSEGALRRAASSETTIGGSALSEAIYERLSLPASLRELVGRRLEALSPAAAQVAQAAAVLGREVDEALLAPMTRLDGAPEMDAVGELVARQVLEQDASGRLRFVHDKIREVAYQRIAFEVRPALHRAAAMAMDAQPEAQRKRRLAALGHHWEQAGEAQQARRAYLAGAVVATADAALSEAERLYRSSLRLVTVPDEESIGALNDLGFQVLHHQGRHEEAREAFQSSLEISRTLGLRKTEADSLRLLGIIHWLTGNLVEAATLLESSLGITRGLDDPAAVSRSLDILASVKHQQNTMDVAQALYEEALALAVESGFTEEEGMTRCNLAGLQTNLGHWSKARANYERGLTLLRHSGNARLEASALGNFGTLLQTAGEMREAEAVYKQALELQQAIGDRRNEAFSTYNLAGFFDALGRSNEARPLYERSLGFARGAGELRLCIINLQGLHGVAMADGALEDAARFLEEAVSLAESLGIQALEGEALVQMSRLKRLGSADLASAASLVLRAEGLVSAIQDVEIQMVHCVEQVYVRLATGRSAEGPVQRARGLVRGLNGPPDGALAQLLSRIERAQAAFMAGEHHRLFRGELLEDMPEGLRRRLTGPDEGDSQSANAQL